jgi:hypothetical protein
MAEVSKDKFLQAYGNLLAQSWADADVLKRFKAAPAAVLAEYGLDAEGAEINILAPDPKGGSDPDVQVKLWNDGKKSGKIGLYFPEEPPQGLKTAELSDQELEAVAGGGLACCCSPCCC